MGRIWNVRLTGDILGTSWGHLGDILVGSRCSGVCWGESAPWFWGSMDTLTSGRKAEW
jgi:hypothetical protein